jgi:hypothetical protein
MIEYQPSETGSIAFGSGQHIEELVTTFVQSLAYYVNPLFNDTHILPLTDPPSARYFDAYSSYYLPPRSTATLSFGMNPPIFYFPEGLQNLSFSTNYMVDIFGASSLPKTFLTQVTLNQLHAHTSPFIHESGNIPTLFPHMNTPSALIGRSINQMTMSQVVHTNKVTKDTMNPSHTSHIGTPYVGFHPSMGGKPSTGGKPLVAGKCLTRGKPTWLKHQQAWDKTTHVIPSIATTIGMYPGHPYPRVVNPLWAQPNPVGIPPQGTSPYQSVNPMITMQQPLTSPYMGKPKGQPQHIGGTSFQSHYMGRYTGQPPYMGGQPRKPPYMGGTYSFFISLQLGYGTTSIPMQYGYHQYQHPNRKHISLTILHILDLSHLENDPILQTPFWPAIPAKLPLEILKFDEKHMEYPNKHVMTFHLWCYSNSLMDDSIHHKRFQGTLTGATTKFYIELPCNPFVNFNSLSTAFLMHFEFPIQYETSTEHLNSIQQLYSTHISDHIHESRRRR